MNMGPSLRDRIHLTKWIHTPFMPQVFIKPYLAVRSKMRVFRNERNCCLLHGVACSHLCVFGCSLEADNSEQYFLPSSTNKEFSAIK